MEMGRNSYLRVAKFSIRVLSWALRTVWWRLIWFPNKCHLLIEISVWARTSAWNISLSIGKKNLWLLKTHAHQLAVYWIISNYLLIFTPELHIYKAICWLLIQSKPSDSTDIKSLTLQSFLRYCACLPVLFGISDLWLLFLWRRFSY